jgi:hypothetical protein
MYRRFEETYCLHLHFERVDCLARFSTMLMETMHSSETLLNFCRTTRCHIASEHSDNLKSNKKNHAFFSFGAILYTLLVCVMAPFSLVIECRNLETTYCVTQYRKKCSCPEDGATRFLRNLGYCVPDHIA